MKYASRRLLLAFLIIMFILIAGCIFFFFKNKQSSYAEAENNLETIVKLKINQIENWRTEQLTDASVLMESPFFCEYVNDWLSNPDSNNAEKILARFRSLQAHYNYREILLVDANYNIKLSLNNKSEKLHESVKKVIDNAIKERKPLLTDLHLDSNNIPHIGVITPLFMNSNGTDKFLAVVILQQNANDFLYPLIQSWPVPSSSAETLLICKDGNSVLFLNELRHQKNTALNLRIPLTRTDVPAVMAVLGKKEVYEGKDYRGVNVISAMSSIPDSPWFMVGKIDAKEAFSVLRRESLLIVIMILGFVGIAGSGFLIAWQNNEKENYRALFQAEKAQRKSELQYATTLMSIGDGVITTDPQGNVELLNPVAEKLTGWRRDEARGKPLEKVFNIVNEETRNKVQNPVRKVISQGTVVGLANHTMLISKDGIEYPIADSGAPIIEKDGSITGVVLVFRDQTEERASQKRLQESRDYIKTVLDNLPIGIAVNSINPDVTFSYMNDNFARFYRTKKEKLSQPDAFWEAVYEDPEFREKIKKQVLDDCASNDPERMCWTDIPITRKNEKTSFITARNIPLADKSLVISSVWDVTERKCAEEALRQSEARFRLFYEESPVSYQSLDEKGNIVEVNNAWLNELGYAREEVIGKWFGDFLAGNGADSFRQRFEKFKEAGEIHNSEFEIVKKDGNVIIASFEGRIGKDIKGEFSRSHCVFVNITERKRAELALEEETTRRRILFDQSPDGIVIIDTQTAKFIEFNTAAHRQLGYSREEFAQLSIFDIEAMETPEETKERISNVIKTGKADFETIQRTKQGELRNIHVTAQIIHFRERAIYQCIWRDITARKRAEEALRKSEAFLSNAIQIAHLGPWEYDVENDVFTFNDAFYSIFKTTVEKVGSYKMSSKEYAKRFCHPEDMELVAIETRKAIETEDPNFNRQLEHRIIYSDGGIGYITVHYFVVKDDKGRTIKTYGVNQDITERKQSEEQLRKLSTAVEQSPAIVVITDSEGNIEYVNPKFTQITGYSFNEVQGKNLRILTSDEMTQEEYQKIWDTIRSANEWHGEFHNRRKDGVLYWERASISPITNASGKITHFIAVKEDITAQKSFEDQLRQAQKMESIGRLAGGVAHDFNNMLQAILGHTDILLKKITESDEIHENLEEILKAAQRSANLTRQLLAFARKQTINPRILDINDTVSSMLKMLQRLIGEDINLVWLPGSRVGNVKIDPSQVDQILCNLALNARDAIAGVGKIIIETYNISLDKVYFGSNEGFASGDYIVLSVTDDGCGMDEETKSHIFEPFFTTKTTGKGTGLGLATIYGIVRQNNGFVNVYSEPGKGTTFKIYLPKCADEAMISAEAESLKKPVGGTETILLVEDEEAILSVGKIMLEQLGYKVLTASKPVEAIEIAEKYPDDIHLLITDVIMPGMNGKELAYKISALKPDLKCLYMSGYTANVIAHRGVLDEGVIFMEKPFAINDLAIKIRTALHK